MNIYISKKCNLILTRNTNCGIIVDVNVYKYFLLEDTQMKKAVAPKKKVTIKKLADIKALMICHRW